MIRRLDGSGTNQRDYDSNCAWDIYCVWHLSESIEEFSLVLCVQLFFMPVRSGG